MTDDEELEAQNVASHNDWIESAGYDAPGSHLCLGCFRGGTCYDEFNVCPILRHEPPGTPPIRMDDRWISRHVYRPYRVPWIRYASIRHAQRVHEPLETGLPPLPESKALIVWNEKQLIP